MKVINHEMKVMITFNLCCLNLRPGRSPAAGCRGLAQSRASSPACLAHSSLLTRPGKNSIASLTSSSIFGVILLT